MFTINEDLSIYVTRGDIVHINVALESKGEPYNFQVGDIVRFKVFGKKDCETVVLQKDFPVVYESGTVEIFLTEQDTRIGGVINKHSDYWYEIELNPETNPQTIIGYDDDGPKIFRLFPEGRNLSKDEPDITPEDIAIIDSELDLSSKRPVENQAIARGIEKTAANLNTKIDSNVAEITGKIDNLEAVVQNNKEALDANIQENYDNLNAIIDDAVRNLGNTAQENYDGLNTKIDDEIKETKDELGTTIQEAVDSFWSYVYPVGSTFVASDSTVNPADCFGGEWEHYDKEFIRQRKTTNEADKIKEFVDWAKDEETGKEILGKCASLRGLSLDYNGHSIVITAYANFVGSYNPDDALVLYELSLYALGISSTPKDENYEEFENAIYTRYCFSQSDAENAISMIKISNDNTNKLIAHYYDRVTQGEKITEGGEINLTFSVEVMPENMMDSFCDKFYWRRIA